METTADLLALDTTGDFTPADTAMLTELDGFRPIPNSAPNGLTFPPTDDEWEALAERAGVPVAPVVVWLGDPTTALWVIR